jgi:glucose-6-phosphate 1-epimerase
VTYTDKVLNGTVKQQSTPEVTITGEVDRVYRSIPQNTTSVVAAGKPRFDIVRDNLADTVVWNPWREKAAAMADFEPKSGYKNMLCVEVGAVSGWQQLDRGERWEGGQFMKSLR